MTESQKIFNLRSTGGDELLSVDDAGNFYVRGEMTESDENVRLVFLEFAKQFLLERIQNKTVVSIRSSVPKVLQQFPTQEDRQNPEFSLALLRAQTRPIIEFSNSARDIHPHVLVGLLQEMIQHVLATKLADDKAQAQITTQAEPNPSTQSTPVSAPKQQTTQARKKKPRR